MENTANLRDVDRVRKKPSVFFQEYGLEGYKNAVKEIIKFAVDEIGKEEHRNIILELLSENVIRLTINGKGIEIEKHYPEKDVFDWELIFTELYGRNKLSEKRPSDEEFSFSPGLPNAFVAAVQFCCRYMEVKSIRNSREHRLFFEKGVNIGGLQSTEIKSDKDSTQIEFRIDEEVLGKADISDAIEYFEVLFEGCSVVAGNICFRLICHRGNPVVERAYRKGYKCR